MEIERKFLIGAFPDLPTQGECIIYQYFLSAEPYLRVRSKTFDGKTNYKLCIKGKGDLTRTEIEFDLTEPQFNELIRLTEYEPIKKLQKRYLLSGGMILECNLVDEGTENEFMYAEVEFEDEQKAKEFTPPGFLLREITYDKNCKMNIYWEKTRIHKDKFEIVQ